MSKNLSSPVVVVLAAGQGRRFQAEGGAGSKLQADLLGRPVLEWTLAAVRNSGLPWVVVERPVQDSERLGMGDSIARGVASAGDAPGWLILPGDMPLIQPGSLIRAAQALQIAATTQPRAVVRPELRVAGERQPGHPVGFGPAWKSDLLALHGDAGAMALVRSAAQQSWLQCLPSEDVGCVYDVDQPADLERAVHHMQRGDG